MAHAVKATRGRPLNTLRFENDELECLYQRYNAQAPSASRCSVSLHSLWCYAE
ncbi:GL20406 [Drosophila persimilis]|uniref:GL20406 n=1 Tax=Drosophila persimilis TaxID=7234 RepID=B4GY37_DROPE|nr:GL20406 [Drosophila persimilis]